MRNKEKFYRAIEKSIIDAMLENNILDGKNIDLSDRDKLWEELDNFLTQLEIAEGKGLFHWVVDHRENLLQEAAYFERKNETILALVFFATYFEHSINRMIRHACNKLKVSEKSIIEIIKIPFHKKITWVSEILQIPKINSNHLKVINNINEIRNSYLHYKFKSEPVGKKDSEEKIDMRKVKKAVTYIKKIESRFIYASKKMKAHNLWFRKK